MTSKKLIVVVGATGNQGGSVVKTFLSLPQWVVRAVTRNPSSEKAQALEASGASVIRADLNDEASLRKAFEGAHAIFINTDFFSIWVPAVLGGTHWEPARHLAYEGELRHVKNAANAAAGVSTLERFVYSALAPMKRGSGGKFDDDFHWESRADGVDYIEAQLTNLAAKTSYIHCGAYVSNPFPIPHPKPKTGEFEMIRNSSSKARWPILDPNASVGPFVRCLVEDEEPKTRLLAYNSYLTFDETRSLWEKVTGKTAAFQHVSLEEMQEYSGLPREILDGPACIDEFGYMPGIDKYIEPHQLKKPFERESFESYLGRQSLETLLNMKFPRFT